MNISQLLEALKDSSSVLSINERFLAGVCVALLSMVVVFIILVLISIIINVLQTEKDECNSKISPVSDKDDMLKLNYEIEDMDELVSVITAAICATTGKSSNNIVVKKIVRSNNFKSSWECMQKNITK